MTKKGDSNPLYDSQREKAGPQTFDKYLYQYHWALYRIITNHDEANEYAIFMELHEDVVISNSLNAELAKFEFNQVKTSKSAFNTYQLVGKKENNSSVLGKLVSSTLNKPYSKLIESLNLISISSFKLELTKKNVDLKFIRKEDLSSKQLKDLEDRLKAEIDVPELPANIKFIVSELPDINYEKCVIGAISELVTKLFPQSYTNAKEIYNLLIDDLRMKGKVIYDFTKWDELLKNKALTSIQVTKVINEFTNIKDEPKIEADFNNICAEIGLRIIQSRKIKDSFSRYKRLRISNRSTLQLDTTNFFLQEIKVNMLKGIIDMNTLIENIQKAIPDKIKIQFTDNDEITAAIICEYIMMK